MNHIRHRQFTGAVLAAICILIVGLASASQVVSQDVVVYGLRTDMVGIAHSARSSDAKLVGCALPNALPTGPSGSDPASVPKHATSEGQLIQEPGKSKLISIAPVQDVLSSSGDRTTRGPMLAASRIDEFAEEDKDKVSVTRATLLSLVLPGAGQWYSGERRRAAGFLAADGLIWVAFGYFETVGAAKRNDYKVYARVHAGIDPSGKDEAFYKTITFYDSRAEYNNIARVYDPRRPYYGTTPAWDWQWDSDASRGHYRTILNQSNEAFNRGKFSIAALALNRLVAALDAMRVARSVNRRARMESGWRIKFDGNPVAADPAFAVTLSRHF
ncbi:MAG: hypothetical protein HZB43_10715 [candidate division Zixibacteria bacterium]|nr:hypothetical protein [candidate division Zixibacteria bacterium]